MSHFYMFGAPRRIAIPNVMSSKDELRKFLGLSEDELKKIWWFRSRMYHRFQISKNSGKSRMISAPDSRLKMLQSKIAGILDAIYKPRHPVHGFVLDRSVKSNATCHLNRRYILNVDLKNFFGSISEARIQGLLQSLGFDKEVAAIVARICCVSGCLPQGAPSSPVLSNMISFRLDRRLMAYCKANRMLYTRYADDLTFSSFQPPTPLFAGSTLPAPGRLTVEHLSDTLRNVIQDNGFEINAEKVHYSDRHSRRAVTGIKINDGLNLDREFIRNVRAILYKVQKSGEAATQAELASRFGKSCSIESYLRGKISWIGFIKGPADPVFRSLASRYNVCFPTRKITVDPTALEMMDRSIWVLSTDKAEGTAFFLKDVGLVTAAHCVNGAETIEIFHHTKHSNKFAVSVAHICPYRDLAILNHDLVPSDYYELSEYGSSPVVGMPTIAAGFPSYGFGDKLNQRPGNIASFAVQHAVDLIEVTQKLLQGMSGGPLMSTDFAVLGVIHKGGPTELRDFAVNLSVLKTWHASLP